MRFYGRLAAIGFAALACFAQSGGRVTGTITDNTGASIADAAIEVVNLETGEVRRTTSGRSGVYVVSPLSVGNYRLQARKEGFKAVTHPKFGSTSIPRPPSTSGSRSGT